jgi:hypothetical protein
MAAETPKKKSGWKSLFVSEEEDASSPARPDPAPIPGNGASPSSHPVPATAMDPESYNRLEAALLAAAPKGFRALLTNLDTLRKAVPDEGTLYKAALAVLAPQGHSVPSLVIDLDQCVKSLELQRAEFLEEIARQTEMRVGARKRELEQVDAETRALVAKRDELVKSIEADSIQIETVRSGFEGAYQVKHAQLLDQKNKLATYGRE